jgi:DNA mismatch repair protein MutS
VPAESADLPILDRVFTRVGASDDIAGGQSTFMVEMTELADILQEATADSLVLLDEVGRGTSTADGLAIAQAVTEYIHDEIGATTLFATHHHPLTETAESLDGAFNLHFAATKTAEDVEFQHRVGTGPATASYGVEVARAAGVPTSVLERSKELLAAETADSNQTETRDDPARDGPPTIEDRLRETNVATTTPMQALRLLDELKGELD